MPKIKDIDYENKKAPKNIKIIINSGYKNSDELFECNSVSWVS